MTRVDDWLDAEIEKLEPRIRETIDLDEYRAALRKTWRGECLAFGDEFERVFHLRRIADFLVRRLSFWQ